MPLAVVGQATAQTYLPSVKIGTAALISTTNAETYYSAHDHAWTDGLGAITGTATPEPTEIIELARALKNDPDNIYQYVHNNIQTVWLYGLQKGALGASIDKSGTAFDQAALMVEILREAQLNNPNITSVSYQAGTITLTGAQFAAWSNITNPQAACQLLSSGGIPAQITTDAGPITDCTTSVGTTVTSITMAHIWVAVTITGSSATGCSASNVCVFDPAYKPYTWKAGISSLTTALGLMPGHTLYVATHPAVTGNLTPPGYTIPFIQSVDTVDLNNLLQSYATNYLNYLQANNLQGAQIEDIVSGGIITPVTGTLRQATLPYTSSVAHNWTCSVPVSCGVSNQYRTKLTLNATRTIGATMTTLFLDPSTSAPPVFFVDQIYGRRLSIDTNFNNKETTSQANYNTFKSRLRLDDQALLTYTDTGETPSLYPHISVTLTADHPYAASSSGSGTDGSYMDETVTKLGSPITPISIVQGWGDTSNALFAKWSIEKVQDTALPGLVGSYDCDNCISDYFGPTGDFTRDKTSAGYLAQYTQAAQLHAALINGVAQLHHVIGVAYGDDTVGKSVPPPEMGFDYIVRDSYARMDIDSALSLTSKTADKGKRRAALHALVATAATIEGSMSAQQQDIPDTASTASRFEWGNAPPASEDPAPGTRPRKFLQFDSTNSGSVGCTGNPGCGVILWENQTTPPPPSGTDRQGSPQNWGTEHQTSLTADITAYTAAGFSVVTSQESWLGPGERGGAYIPPLVTGEAWDYLPTKQRGNAFVATKYASDGSPSEITHAVSGVSQVIDSTTYSVIKGGGGAAETDNQSQYDPGSAADDLKSKFVDRATIEGVDLTNGSVAYQSPVSLSVGSGDFPFKLTATLHFRAGAVPDSTLGPLAPYSEPTAEWTTNWHNSLSISGSGMELMGQSDIRALAGTLAAFLAEQDIFTTSDSTPQPSQAQIVAGTLTSAWWSHQLTGNVATVALGASNQQFIKLPDSSWIAPGAGFAKLNQNSNRAVNEYLCPKPSGGPNPPLYPPSRGWDYTSVSFDVTNSGGDVEHFAHWLTYYNDDVDLCSRQQGWRLMSWDFPQNKSGTPSVQIKYTTDSTSTIAEVDNNVGRKLVFTGAGSVTTISDGGSRSITAGVGGVAIPSHTDPMLQTTNYTYNAPIATSATHRPVPYRTLNVAIPPDPNSPLGTVQYFYDSEGRVNQVKDAAALNSPPPVRAPYQFYIADGTRGEHDDPLGQAYTVLYDTYGHPAHYIDEVGNKTDALLDSRSRPLQYVFPEGNCQAFAYDDHNNTTDTWQVDTTSSCNTAAGPAHVLHASASWDQTWNKPSIVTNARGKTTTLTYYPSSASAGSSLLWTAQRPAIPEGTPLYSFTYNTYGNVLTSVTPLTSAPLTLTTKYDYQPNEDPKDTIVDYGTTGHLNLTTYYLYNSVGDLTQMTDPRGSVTVSYFDADRRKYEDDYHNGGLGAALNYATQTKYDAVGRDYEDDVAICFDSASPCHTSGTTVATWQPVKKTGYTYTSKVHTVMDADGRTIATDYDDADRAAKVTDPVSRVTVLTYCANGDANCAANQVKNEIRAWHGGTSCTYGSTLQECYRQVAYYPNGEQKSVTDANGNTTNFVYDLWRRLRRTRYADTTPAHPDEEVLTLDENSNVTARQMRSGGIISYGYNDLDWMTTKAMPISGGTLNTSWTYRLNGKIATLGDDAAGGGNSLTYGYDSADRMTSTATLIPGFSGSQTASYNLDANGNRTKLIWPSTGGAYAVGYCYDNMNRMSQASENPSGTDCTGGSSLATYAYDPLSNRTGVTYGNGASETASFYVSTGTAHYSPDLQTLTHKMPSTGPAYTFGYSNAHQLNSEAISDASYVWQPTADATTSYMPNNLNQYTTVNGFAYTYDGNGNMTSDHIWTYGYDLENHLLTANKTAGGTVAASYNYDPLGRRNEKSGTGVTQTYFLSDGTDEITEYNSPGTATVRYIPGPSIDEPIAMITVSSGAKEYFHTNKQGSVIAMTNGSTGALAEGPYKYDPYGNCFSGASPCSPVAGSTAPYRFTGRRLDPETGLYYYRARYYASGDTNGGGRFLQTDAVGYTADLDLYTYVGNDPTDKGDPSGNFVYGMPHDACLLFCDPSSPDQGTNVDGLSGVTASIETGVIGGAASQITGNSGSNSGAQMRAYTPVTGPLGTLRGTGVVNGPAVDISYDPGDIITFQMDPDLMGGTEKTPQSPTPSARSSRAARSHPGSGGEEQGMLGWDRSAAWQAYQVQENGVGELKPPVYLGGLSFAAPVQTAGPFKSVILPSVLEIRFSDLNETAGGPPVFVDIWTRPAEPHS